MCANVTISALRLLLTTQILYTSTHYLSHSVSSCYRINHLANVMRQVLTQHINCSTQLRLCGVKLSKLNWWVGDYKRTLYTFFRQSVSDKV